MTRQTLLVVISRIIFSERFVRIVTGDTTYLALVRITLAVKNAIRLKTNVVDAHALQQRELIAATMTRSAKLLRQLVATQPPGIEDRRPARLSIFDRRNVPAAWSMTTFAAHAMREIFKPKL